MNEGADWLMGVVVPWASIAGVFITALFLGVPWKKPSGDDVVSILAPIMLLTMAMGYRLGRGMNPMDFFSIKKESTLEKRGNQ